MEVVAKIKHRDEISLTLGDDEKFIWKAQGCLNLLRRVDSFRQKNYGVAAITKILDDLNDSHEDLLIKEVMLKWQDKWNLPYNDKEMCHCRSVDTEEVIDAIQSGADSVEKVGRYCTAGTSCGSCKPDIEATMSFLKS